MLVGLDLPSADRGTETRVQSPLQGKCLSQRRNIKAESETADLWQPKWNENQTVLEAAICTPDRDTGPLEGAAAAKSLQSCPTLCDHLDGSPPGSSIHGIFQAGVLEWDAIAFSIWKSYIPPILGHRSLFQSTKHLFKGSLLPYPLGFGWH